MIGFLPHLSLLQPPPLLHPMQGYTIPLDKRLAADGRGLQEVAINDQFAKFTESLYIAEQKARSSVEARSKMQRELLAREKERKERELRELALKARMDRIGGVVPGASDRLDGGVPATAAAAPAPPAAGRAEAAAMDVSSDDERERRSSRRDRDRGGDRDRDRDRGGDRERERGGESREEREERRKREEIREERRRERERERRLEAKDAHGFKKSKLTRDRDRDISEKIALGMAKVGGWAEAEGLEMRGGGVGCLVSGLS